MKIAHVGLLVSDLQRAEQFYFSILGLTQGVRPELGFAGLFLDLEGGQQIHLMQLDNPYEACIQPEHGGRDRHIALSCPSVDEVIRRLDAQQIAYTRSRSGRAAIFFRDPDGNSIELTEEQA